MKLTVSVLANRAVVNPYCGSTFSGSARTFSLTEYVEPNGVNYYRIHPNYFYTGDGNRKLKITENSYGIIQVCISRIQAKPTNISDTCQMLRSSVQTTDVSGYCSGSVMDCAPIYLSVQGIATNTRCRGKHCFCTTQLINGRHQISHLRNNHEEKF